MELQFYRVEKKNDIAWVYLNRPEKKNAMNPPAWDEPVKIFDDLSKDEAIRAVIIAAEGDDFCAGIDLIEMMPAIPAITNQDQRGGTKAQLLKTIYWMQKGLTAIERCTKPVIAAVHGKCIGAGLDMITACDIRLCSEDASFSLREAAVGFVADVGVLQRLPNIVGQGITRELAYTADDISAERARHINLVNNVYNTKATLMEEAEAMARRIADNSPLAVQASKQVLNHAITGEVDAQLEYVAAISANIIPSGDLMEAFTAFSQKRKPVFTGK